MVVLAVVSAVATFCLNAWLVWIGQLSQKHRHRSRFNSHPLHMIKNHPKAESGA